MSGSSVKDLSVCVVLEPLQVGWKEVEGAIVLVEMGAGAAFVLKGVSAHIWKMLSEGYQPAEIKEVLLEVYEARPEQIEADLLEFLNSLASQKFIHVN